MINNDLSHSLKVLETFNHEDKEGLITSIFLDVYSEWQKTIGMKKNEILDLKQKEAGRDNEFLLLLEVYKQK